MQDIGFFPDDEINARLQEVRSHHLMQGLLQYAFPKKSPEEIDEIYSGCHSTRDFHACIIYPALRRLLEETSDGLTSSGFEELEKDQAYLYIANHRDIVLDTALTHMVLLEQEMIMVASAIGDNLVQDSVLHHLSKINRNFLVLRGASPREMLRNSMNLSQFIAGLIEEENRSVWIAQREGRAKDGNDTTNPAVLKMLSLGKDRREKALDHIAGLQVVPLTVSYELDPTDFLKVRELVALAKDDNYKKSKGEDFQSILTGLLGQKGRIHLQAGAPMKDAIAELATAEGSEPKKLQDLCRLMDREIQRNYHLWPTNYIACDELTGEQQFASEYTEAEKEAFLDRMDRQLREMPEPEAREIFLRMYANPVRNSPRPPAKSAGRD